MVRYFAEYSIHTDSWVATETEDENELKLFDKYKQCWVEISKECYDKLKEMKPIGFPCGLDGTIDNLEKRIIEK